MNVFKLLVLFLPVFTITAAPDYSATRDEVEKEAEERNESIVNEVPTGDIPFGEGLNAEAIKEGQETGTFRTRRLEQGEETLVKERMTANLTEWYLDSLEGNEALAQDLTKETDLSTSPFDGDESNGDFDLLAKQEAQDEALFGPMAKKADPAFAKAGSNSLNPAPHAPSQQGDSCMSAEGNSAELTVAPVKPTFSNPCDGQSFAEKNDCRLDGNKQMNSSSNGASGNSTQVGQPIVEPAPDKLQNVQTAGRSEKLKPSCPTQPRLAESVMPDVSSLISGDRQKFEQATLSGGLTSNAISYEPPQMQVAQTVLPWYQRLISWVLPVSTLARGELNATSTLRGQTGRAVQQNNLTKQNLEKTLADMHHHPDVHAEQQFANRVNLMLEAQHKFLESSLLPLATEEQEEMTKLANKSVKPF